MPPEPAVLLIPIGDTATELLQSLVPVLRETFGHPVLLGPAIPLPRAAWRAARGQCLARVLVDVMAEVKRPEWHRVLGVTDVDLFAPRLNFVFGEGDPARGVAVISTYRLLAAPRPLGGAHDAPPSHEEGSVQLAAAEAVHELGHTYGLQHCDDPDCVMWFSNTLAETVRKGHRFCARHQAELATREAWPV